MNATRADAQVLPIRTRPHPDASQPPEDTTSVHLPNKLVDVLLPVAEITALNEMSELSRPESTSWIAQLERPEEVARLLEVGADGVDLMDQVLHAHDAVLAEMLLDDGIVGKRDALLLTRFGIAALVDELAHGFEVRVAVGDEGLDDLQHFRRGFCEADEAAVVDLEEAEELEGLALLGVDLVDTLDADDEDEFGFRWDVVGAFLLGYTSEADLLALCIAVLFDVGLGALEDLLAFLLLLLWPCQCCPQTHTVDKCVAVNMLRPERW